MKNLIAVFFLIFTLSACSQSAPIVNTLDVDQVSDSGEDEVIEVNPDQPNSATGSKQDGSSTVVQNPRGDDGAGDPLPPRDEECDFDSNSEDCPPFIDTSDATSLTIGSNNRLYKNVNGEAMYVFSEIFAEADFVTTGPKETLVVSLKNPIYNSQDVPCQFFWHNLETQANQCITKQIDLEKAPQIDGRGYVYFETQGAIQKWNFLTKELTTVYSSDFNNWLVNIDGKIYLTKFGGNLVQYTASTQSETIVTDGLGSVNEILFVNKNQIVFRNTDSYVVGIGSDNFTQKTLIHSSLEPYDFSVTEAGDLYFYSEGKKYKHLGATAEKLMLMSVSYDDIISIEHFDARMLEQLNYAL